MKNLIKKIALVFVLSFVIWGDVFAEPDFWTKWESYNYKRCIEKNNLPKADLDTCKCVAAMYLKTQYADRTRGGHIGSVNSDYLQTLESKLISNSICVMGNSSDNGFKEVTLKKGDYYEESKFIKLKDPRDFSFFCTLAGYPRCEGFKWNCGMVKGYKVDVCSKRGECPEGEYWDEAHDTCMSSDRINVDWEKDAKDPEGDKDNDKIPNIADKDSSEAKLDLDITGKNNGVDQQTSGGNPEDALDGKITPRMVIDPKTGKQHIETPEEQAKRLKKENTILAQAQDQDNSVTIQVKTMTLTDYQETRCNGNNKGLVRYDPLCDDKNIAGRGSKNATEEFMKTLNRILDWLVRIVLLFGVGVIVWAGFLYVWSSAEPKKKEEAKKKIYVVLIGWFFVLAAFLIVQLILNTFAIGGVGGKFSGLDPNKEISTEDRQPLK